MNQNSPFWGWLVVGDDVNASVNLAIATYTKKFGAMPKRAAVLESSQTTVNALRAVGVDVETRAMGILPRDIDFYIE